MKTYIGFVMVLKIPLPKQEALKFVYTWSYFWRNLNKLVFYSRVYLMTIFLNI